MLVYPSFPRYREHSPLVPAWIITHRIPGRIHRFFDTSPLSPSGRYLAVFRFPQEESYPVPGEAGEVIVIDLHTGDHEVVASTSGWESQMGCNLNWGGDDRTLLFNDVDPLAWKPLGVRLDWTTRQRNIFPRGIYQASPDGQRAVCGSLETMRRTQRGYGVVVPDETVPWNEGFPADDGLYLTNTITGDSRLLVSLRQVLETFGARLEIPEPEKGSAYVFHSKWNPQGDRILFTIRWIPPDTQKWDGIGVARFLILTVKPDGGDLTLAIPASKWEQGGHHINWHPDGRHLTMNLGHFGNTLRFVRGCYDGSVLEPIRTDMLGSGHPSLHPDGRHLITDTYLGEPMAFGDGTVPIRWIDLETGHEECLLRISSSQPFAARQRAPRRSAPRVEPDLGRRRHQLHHRRTAARPRRRFVGEGFVQSPRLNCSLSCEMLEQEKHQHRAQDGHEKSRRMKIGAIGRLGEQARDQSACDRSHDAENGGLNKAHGLRSRHDGPGDETDNETDNDRPQNMEHEFLQDKG